MVLHWRILQPKACGRKFDLFIIFVDECVWIIPLYRPFESTYVLILILKSLVMTRNKSRSSLPWCSGNCLRFIFKPSPYLNLLSLAYHTWDHPWAPPLLWFRWSTHWPSLYTITQAAGYASCAVFLPHISILDTVSRNQSFPHWNSTVKVQ